MGFVIPFCLSLVVYLEGFVSCERFHFSLSPSYYLYIGTSEVDPYAAIAPEERKKLAEAAKAKGNEAFAAAKLADAVSNRERGFS